MVDDVGPDSLAFFSALPAKRLSKKLPRPEFFLPQLRLIHPMPVGTLLPLLRLWLMLLTPALTSNLRASRMSARSQRLAGHTFLPPGQKTKPGPITAPIRVWSLAPALKALAHFDVHRVFGFTAPAVYYQLLGSGILPDLHQLRAAGRAADKSIYHWQNFTTTSCAFQAFYPQMPELIRKYTLFQG